MSPQQVSAELETDPDILTPSTVPLHGISEIAELDPLPMLDNSNNRMTIY